MAAQEYDEVFISYSSDDIDLVFAIKEELIKNDIKCFVAEDAITGGTPTMDAITYALSKCRAGLFLVTPAALESSWFAFETILTLERFQQRGHLNCVILLHGVTEDQLPQFALFQMIDRYVLNLDESGKWKTEQISQVIRTLREVKTIDSVLPVGNVAHALAWSHYFGYHHVIHPHLSEKIRECPWFNDNMPIAVYELVPKSSIIPREINDERMKLVGTLKSITVKIAGNKERPYKLNVYCIEDGEEKYHCVVQYPSVQSTIRQMEDSPMIDMDEAHKVLQMARFYYTLHTILQHSNANRCREQSRLLWFDGKLSINRKLPYIFREISDVVVHEIVTKIHASLKLPLMLLFNKTLESGIIPISWKKTNVNAIYKGNGSSNDVLNYRPISSRFSKIMENNLCNFLIENDIITKQTYNDVQNHSWADITVPTKCFKSLHYQSKYPVKQSRLFNPPVYRINNYFDNFSPQMCQTISTLNSSNSDLRSSLSPAAF